MRVFTESAQQYADRYIDSYVLFSQRYGADLVLVAHNSYPQPTIGNVRRLAGQGRPVEAALVLRSIPQEQTAHPSEKMKLLEQGWENHFRRSLRELFGDVSRKDFTAARWQTQELGYLFVHLARVMDHSVIVAIKELGERRTHRSRTNRE